ncbi:MAG: hypothetical protein RMM58_10105 [Chloroflexota bacterium]|nr:hypothetical protein [Dehalococcoidia bacterium]MDW8254218.1 hypothetical protein [Chloroflexota bacterium]
MAKLISAKDIEAAAAAGQRTVTFGSGQIVTPAAKDRARELGITIVGANGASAPAAPAQPSGQPTSAPVSQPAASAAPTPPPMFVPVSPPSAPSAPGEPTFIPPSQATYPPPTQPVVQGPVTAPPPPPTAGGITDLRVEVDDRDNPVYFESPVIDNLFNITLELGAALWVVKDRLRVIEELLDQKGILTTEQIERYRTPPEREREVRAKRDQFIERIYKSIRDNPG